VGFGRSVCNGGMNRLICVFLSRRTQRLSVGATKLGPRASNIKRIASSLDRTRSSSRGTSGWAVPMSFLLFSAANPDRLVFGDESLKKDLIKQEEKLNRETNVVGKVKALIRIADIHLRSANEEASNGDFAASDRKLELYKGSIEKSLELLKSSRRNAQKNPAGFREFEISLRKQLRVLEDLRSNYSYDQVQTIDAVSAAAKSAQDAMLAEIFGPENAGRRRDGEKDSSRPSNQP